MFMFRHKNNNTKKSLSGYMHTDISHIVISSSGKQGNVVLYIVSNDKKNTCITLVFYAFNLMLYYPF